MKKIILSIILTLAFASLGNTQTLTHKRLTVSSGGGVATFDEFTNRAVIGQVAIGESSDSVFVTSGGFLGGGDDWITAIFEELFLPTEFNLSQNYPNPFNPATTINYALAKPGHVRMEVYDILGRRLDVLVDEQKEAGYHSYIWQASNVPTGVYFYRIKAGDFEKTKKMMLLK